LRYPIIVSVMIFLVGVLFLRETKDTDIVTSSGPGQDGLLDRAIGGAGRPPRLFVFRRFAGPQGRNLRRKSYKARLGCDVTVQCRGLEPKVAKAGSQCQLLLIDRQPAPRPGTVSGKGMCRRINARYAAVEGRPGAAGTLK